MAIPQAANVENELRELATQAKADLAWLAAYQASTKSHQKSWEALVGNKLGNSLPFPPSTIEQVMRLMAPLPDDIIADPQRNLQFANHIKARFFRTFCSRASRPATHDFGHYLNLAPIVIATAILEEFVEKAYFVRTGGASLRKPRDFSRSLNTYIKIIDYEQRAPANLVSHENHLLVKGLMNVSQEVRRLADLRHTVSHAYRDACYNANWDTVVQYHLEKAIQFIDEATEKFLKEVEPRPRCCLSSILLITKRLLKRLFHRHQVK